MNKRLQERLKNLNAKKMRRALPTRNADVLEVLLKIEEARKEGKKVCKILAGEPKLLKELENRDFTVKDTGKVWHISWE